ncbi:MAG TPA: hypothetical protein VEK07_04960 [Polyangiaceae bacterium]|nr:hypothetical protein [Polyangiaceae bacterium]
MKMVLSKSVVRTAVVAGLGVSISGAVIQVGCSSSGGQPPGEPSPGNLGVLGSNSAENTGSVGMQLTLPGGESVNTVSWTITGPNGASTVVQTGTVNLANSETISFLVGGIPAANGYLITLSGTSSDGLATCTGSATFNTTARTTTDVSVLLQCNTAVSEAGSALVTATPYSCASVNYVTASPAETTLGNTVAVSGSASGPGAGGDASPLTYQWTATSGEFDTPTAPSANFTCLSAGPATVTLTVSAGPVPDGGACNTALETATVTIQCDQLVQQSLVTTLAPGVLPTIAVINQGTAIGEGSQNGATPFMITNLAADPNNSQVIQTNDGGPPFLATGNVPDTAYGFCNYPTDGGAPTRITHVTGAKFETAMTDPMVPLTPAYFPLVYNTTNTTKDNAFGGDGGFSPIIGLFDWRPKDNDEAVLAAESDDNGKTWYFMQNVLELDPDYTNPISGGYSDASTNTGCPATLQSTNVNRVSVSGSQDDDGWGHASIIQLPGLSAATGQFLYLLDRNTNNLPDSSVEIVDGAPLWVISLATSTANGGSTNKFPIWNTNFTGPGNNDMKSISSVLNQTPDSGAPINIQQTVGLTDPDGIMAVFPTAASTPVGSAVTVLWVQKILNGDDTGSTALPTAEQCTAAPFSGKINHDIATVRLATTTDGIHFTDLGPVNGLSNPTTVDYNQNRWVSPRGTLIDIYGNQTLWGLYFAAGNCLDGDSDAFHYIGYAESPDKVNWTIYNGINNPIASINPITTTNQFNGETVTIPANPPIVPTQSWFAERLYAPSATQIDPTHLSMTFAGYGVQTPNNDLLDYRQIGNVVLTVSRPLPAGVPNNINTH